ncbi:hypothetical protein E2562_013851, partial [Oryza meyeriana var. granulata]
RTPGGTVPRALGLVGDPPPYRPRSRRSLRVRLRSLANTIARARQSSRPSPTSGGPQKHRIEVVFPNSGRQPKPRFPSPRNSWSHSTGAAIAAEPFQKTPPPFKPRQHRL